MKSITRKMGRGMVLLCAVLLATMSCSKDDNNGGPTPSKPKKVIFKAETNAGSKVNMVVHGYDATLTTVSSIGNQTWTSAEIEVPASANVASITANGIGASATATMKVQFIVDGVVKKEGTSTGTALVANAQFNLK